VPELCVFGTTDNANGVTRNAWNPARTAGGSSGGSAAAVAAGIVPVAHAADGMGSIRIPAAANGVFGIKPGRGVVPSDMGVDSWGGMSENGVIARSVEDAARVLAVMADDPSLAEPGEPSGSLSITVAANTPSFLVSLDREWREALERTAAALAAAGHTVTERKFPYPANPIPLFARWWSGVATDAADLPFEKLERRVQGHVKMGRRAQRRGWVNEADANRAREAAEAHLAGHDILMTPMLARGVPEAAVWRDRSWLANSWSNLRYAPYAAMWNMLSWPAASVPAGLDAHGMPLAVQLVARPGREALLLQVAAQLERLQPWPFPAAGG
jgi:amidase